MVLRSMGINLTAGRREGKTMKKYVTFVKDEEESRKVQEALFSAGFKWHSASNGETHVQYTEYPFINITEGCFCGDDRFLTAVSRVRSTHEAIEARSIIDDPFQLDGATKPEEMIEIDGSKWSVSTVKEALRKHAS